MAGMWELPEVSSRNGEHPVSFTVRHSITVTDFVVRVTSGPVLDAFLAGAWMLHFTDDTLYWVAKPAVHVETIPGGRRLHSDKTAALESAVERLYFWHGVLVPAFVVVRPDWITLDHIAVMNRDYLNDAIDAYPKTHGGQKHLRFCIDRYEFPNLKGVKPVAAVNWEEAAAGCARETPSGV